MKSNQHQSIKKWKPDTTKYQTPTSNLDNQIITQSIQRPGDFSDYQGYFSRPEPHKDAVKTKPQSPRINPDSLKTLWFTVGLIIILGVTSFLVSFNGLLDVAAWVGLPHSLRWTVPAFIDVSILAYSMAAVIHKARNEKVAATWVSLGVFTLISVVANAVHAMSNGEGTTMVQMVIGATIAAAAPIAVFAATEELSRLAFRSPVATTNSSPEDDEEEMVEVQEVPQRAELSGQERSDSAVVAEPESLRQVSAPRPNAVVEEELAVVQEASESEPETAQQEVTPPAPVQSFVSEPVQEIPTEKSTESLERPYDQQKKETAGETVNVLDDDMLALAEWVKVQQEQGEKITGAMVAEHIGKSPRTGNNRLNQLKEAMPELFENEA